MKITKLVQLNQCNCTYMDYIERTRHTSTPLRIQSTGMWLCVIR